jgi:hypothetical protein
LPLQTMCARTRREFTDFTVNINLPGGLLAERNYT